MRTIITLIVAMPAVVYAQGGRGDGAPLASSQDTPRSILERAIVAHGGQERLSSGRSEYVKLKGTIETASSSMTFTNEMALQLPGQYRSVVTMSDVIHTHVVTHLLDGDKAMVLVNGKPQPVSPLHLTQLKQTLELERALRLVPLLTDPEYTLHPLPEVRYNTHVYVGVRIQRAGQRELKLYFDRASGLLVKTEHRLDGPDGKEVLQEAFYGNHRDVGGRIRAGTVVILRDGKKVMQSELVEARRVERIDPREFSQHQE